MRTPQGEGYRPIIVDLGWFGSSDDIAEEPDIIMRASGVIRIDHSLLRSTSFLEVSWKDCTVKEILALLEPLERPLFGALATAN